MLINGPKTVVPCLWWPMNTSSACAFQVWNVRDGIFVNKIHKQEILSLANNVYRQGACSVHHNY